MRRITIYSNSTAHILCNGCTAWTRALARATKDAARAVRQDQSRGQIHPMVWASTTATPTDGLVVAMARVLSLFASCQWHIDRLPNRPAQGITIPSDTANFTIIGWQIDSNRSVSAHSNARPCNYWQHTWINCLRETQIRLHQNDHSDCPLKGGVRFTDHSDARKNNQTGVRDWSCCSQNQSQVRLVRDCRRLHVRVARLGAGSLPFAPPQIALAL